MSDQSLIPSQRLQYAVGAKSNKSSSRGSKAKKKDAKADKKDGEHKNNTKKRAMSAVSAQRVPAAATRALFFHKATPLGRGSDSQIKRLHE